MKTPLKKARGLGSAKSGTTHWWIQRITSIALVPLTVWFIASLLSTSLTDYESAITWIASPWTAGLLTLIIIIGFYHAALGIQVVVEDYVKHGAWKITLLLTIKGTLLVMAVVAILAVLQIMFQATVAG